MTRERSATMQSVASRVSSPAFIGRAAPLERLRAAAARAAAGESTAVVVGGEAGVGKTRLLREFATQVDGWRVLTGTCIDLGEAGPPFGPMVEMLRALVRVDGAGAIRAHAGPAAAELGRLVPELDVPNGDGPGDAPGGATRLFEVVLGLFARLAVDGPVLLLVEDLHWADRSTRDLLAYLIHQLGTARVAIVTTYRADELNRRHPLRPWLAELERSGRAERVDLERFDRDDVAAQLHGILGEVPTPEAVEAVFVRSDGNRVLHRGARCGGREPELGARFDERAATVAAGRVAGAGRGLFRTRPRSCCGSRLRPVAASIIVCSRRSPTATTPNSGSSCGRRSRSSSSNRAASRSTRSGTRCSRRRCTTSCSRANGSTSTPPTRAR